MDREQSRQTMDSSIGLFLFFKILKRIHISPLSEEKCQEIIKKCGNRIQNMEELMTGNIAEEMKDVFQERGDTVMSERADKAEALFKSGYNCAQSVVGAYADLFDMEPETAMRFAEGLGGGLGRMRLTCGAVSGMALVAGMVLSSGKPDDLDAREKVYESVQQMANLFQARNGSLMCRELLGEALPKGNSTRPQKRNEQFYKERPCLGYVRQCAESIEQILGPDELAAGIADERL